MSFDLALAAEEERRRRKREGIILNAPAQWNEWLSTIFPHYFSAPFARRHEDFWGWVESVEKDKRPTPFVAIWGRGGGKCLSADTEIMLSSGLRKTIKDVRVGDKIISYSESEGRFVSDAVSKKYYSGKKQVMRIKTKAKKSIRLTSEHLILTYCGWKTAGELTIYDRIASPRRVPINPYIFDKTDEEVRFTAYILAEGGTSGKSSCLWTNSDGVIINDFKYCAESLGFSIRPSGRYGYYVRGASEWVRKNRLDGKLSINKRIPEWVFGLTERQKWLFLSAFIDTDGWVTLERGRLGITLANREMIVDLQYIFMQLGVLTVVYEKKNKHAGAWTVAVDSEYAELCSNRLSLLLKGDKLRQSLGGCKTKYSLLDVYPCEAMQGLPGGLNRKIRNISGMKLGNSAYDVTRGKLRRAMSLFPLHRWLKLEEDDVFWDRIVSIENDAGTEETFDIEVMNNHNMITNGLVTHNSTNAEAAAIRLAAKKVRRYAWYVSSTQDKADQHVDTIGAMLEDSETAKYYPELSDRALNKYGFSKGWRRQRLRTASGFTIDALGMDTGARGAKIDDQRPDLIVIDDVDELFDSVKSTLKKIKILTQSILPAGSKDCAVLFIQNLIHADSIASRLADNRADFLTDKILSGPYPAVNNLIVSQVQGKYTIQGGEPTWAGQDLATCQSQISTWGYSAFMQESQHDVDRGAGAWREVQFQHIDYTALPEFVRTAVWIDPAVSSTEQSDSMGISAGGITRAGKVIGLYWWEGITSPEDVLERGILKAMEVRATHVGVETDQGGDTWKSVYLRSLEKIKKRLKTQMSAERYNRLIFPAFTSRKAGGTDETTGRAYGSKVERNSKMLADYERGMVLHMNGTHPMIEKALWRFPKEPLDLADSWFWCWNDLRNKPQVRAL